MENSRKLFASSFAIAIAVLVVGVNSRLVQAHDIATGTSNWTAVDRNDFIAGCREAVLTFAAQQYLKRHRITTLPAGFQEKITPVLEPMYVSCSCALPLIEAKWSRNDITGKVVAVANEFLVRLFDHECAPDFSRFDSKSHGIAGS